MLTIKVKPGTVAKDIKAAREGLRNLNPVLRVMAERFKSLVDASFLESRSPAGTAWKPLAASTLKQKRRNRHSPKPLIRSGARGLQGQVSVEAVGNAVHFRVPGLVGYGRYHQTGGGFLPRRAFLPFDGVPGAATLAGGQRVNAIVADFGKALKRHLFPGDL